MNAKISELLSKKWPGDHAKNLFEDNEGHLKSNVVILLNSVQSKCSDCVVRSRVASTKFLQVRAQ